MGMDQPAFTLLDASALPEAALHAATIAAFADYLAGPFQLTLEQFPAFVARQGIALEHSRVALAGGAIAAFAFACPRPEVGRWRLAILGALPAARGTGAGPALLDDFVARAAAAGLPWAELECFAANERALRLYRGRGFEVCGTLEGWQAPAAAPPAAAADAAGVQVVERGEALAWLAAADRRLGWLAFPVADRCMAAQQRPLTFWRRGGAQLAFSAVAGTPTQLHSLVDLDPALADAEALARALRAAHPGVFSHPVIPAAFGGAALPRAGFVPHGLSQVLLRRPAR